MKYLTKIWDLFLLVFAFSTTKHCDKMTFDDDDKFSRGGQ